MFNATHRVMWADGMLMSSQHLQQQDAWHDSAREQRLASLVQDSWGVGRVQLDAPSLADGRVVISALSATFPSGTSVAWDHTAWDAQTNAVPVARSIAGAFAPTLAVLPVFVGLARLHPGAANVAQAGAAPTTHQRYIAQRRSVAEYTHAQTPAVEVAFAVPYVQVIFGSEPAEHLELVQIGELARDAQGRLRWVETFIPPCLHTGASPALMAAFKLRLGRVMARLRHLAGLCAHRRRAEHALQVSEMLHFTHLSAVQSAVPWLDELAHAPKTAPRLAYLLLKQIIGHLCILAPEAEPILLPPLQHVDLRQSFDAAFVALDGLLAPGDAGAHTDIALVPQTDGSFLAAQLTPHLTQGGTWLLTVKGADVQAEQADRWVRWARVACASEMPSRIQAAVLGVGLTHVERPPAAVPWQPDVLYFQIDTGHAAWQGVQAEATLAVVPPPGDPGANLAIGLIVDGARKA